MADCRRPAVWSPEARADLSEIWDYYARASGQHRADSIVHEISRASQLIRNHPLAGRARDEIRPGIRSIPARPYVVFYRIRDDVPEIVRVLHGRRDIANLFPEDATDS